MIMGYEVLGAEAELVTLQREVVSLPCCAMDARLIP